MKRLDEVQRWHLYELGLTDTEAFVNYNFASPSLRRCIGMLGFLHKRALGKCHPGLCAILPFAAADVQADYHSRALHAYEDLID